MILECSVDNTVAFGLEASLTFFGSLVFRLIASNASEFSEISAVARIVDHIFATSRTHINLTAIPLFINRSVLHVQY